MPAVERIEEVKIAPGGIQDHCRVLPCRADHHLGDRQGIRFLALLLAVWAIKHVADGLISR
jgi:hypothetical protein